MKKWILGMALSALGLTAFAGFVDERKPTSPPASVASTASAHSSGAVAAVRATEPVGYSVLKSDQSVRETLTRWAASAGWAHLPEHWAIAEDYSVGGTAGPEVFGADFKGAVRVLISSTDLTSRPAQPCFYANNVVRVIPRAGICDPTAQ